MIYYIHSDFTSYIKIKKIQKMYEQNKSKNFINIALKLMSNDIENLFGKNYILPTYNYDFPKSKIFNLNKDVSQTGIFTEFCRKKSSFYRSNIPIFSSISRKKNLIINNHNKIINPFDKNSEWENLYLKKGKIVNFGSLFSPTYIHYIEHKYQGTLHYRYFKKFNGKIKLTTNIKKTVELEFMVRTRSIKEPLYDVKKIKNELIREGILKSYIFEKSLKYDITDARDFSDYAISKMRKDKMYFLNKKDKAFLVDILKKKKRII